MDTKTQCSIAGCVKPTVNLRGYCAAHYQRWRCNKPLLTELRQRYTSIRQVIEERCVAIPIAGCWIWMGALSQGYGDIRTKDNHFRAHRASYEAFVGPIPDGLWVLHRCDVRACCNPHHLFLGTRHDNIADATIKGRMKHPGRVRSKGLVYKRPLAYLDKEIIELDASGYSLSHISKRFDIDRGTVLRALKSQSV